MFIDKKKLMNLMDVEFEGNYRKCSKALGVEAAQLHRILNTGAQAGPVFLGRFHEYCVKEKKDFNDFIFFDSSVYWNKQSET